VQHEEIKESELAANLKGREGLAELTENSHKNKLTLQNSRMQEETVADENVDNFKSNQVRIDFAIRAN
jgi:hypothetical protein